MNTNELLLKLLLAFGYAQNGFYHLNSTTASPLGNYYGVLALTASVVLDSTGTTLGAGTLSGNMTIPEGVLVPGNYTQVKLLNGSTEAALFITPPENFNPN